MTARAIDWDDIAKDARPHHDAIANVIASWEGRAKQEHLAVGAFALIAHEVAEVGSETVVMDLLTRAANDEVRHANVCARMAAALAGKTFEPVKWRGVPKVPMHPKRTLEERTTLHIVEMCCLSETFTGVCFTEMIARATHPESKRVVSSLLEDEIDHGKVGWAFLAERRPDLGFVKSELPAMMERMMRAGLDPAERKPETDDPICERYGYLATSTVAALYKQTLREVILPGFDHVGVDTAEARRHASQRGWL